MPASDTQSHMRAFSPFSKYRWLHCEKNVQLNERKINFSTHDNKREEQRKNIKCNQSTVEIENKTLATKGESEKLLWGSAQRERSASELLCMCFFPSPSLRCVQRNAMMLFCIILINLGEWNTSIELAVRSEAHRSLAVYFFFWLTPSDNEQQHDSEEKVKQFSTLSSLPSHAGTNVYFIYLWACAHMQTCICDIFSTEIQIIIQFFPAFICTYMSIRRYMHTEGGFIQLRAHFCTQCCERGE